MKTIAFSALVLIVVASLTAGAALISVPSEHQSAQQSGNADTGNYNDFEHALLLDASELEWLDCSWAALRCY